MTLNADPRGSDSLANLIAHLAGPFRGGAVDTALDLVPTSGGDAHSSVAFAARQPLLLLGLRAAVGPTGFTVTAQVTPSGGAAETVKLRFAPFTEAGALLPAWPLHALADAEAAPPFDLVVHVDGGPAGAGAADLVQARLVEGVLGRLLYIATAEKQRLRRQAEELVALRRLRFALDANNPDHLRLGSALDRLGADLGAPRFADRLAWDAARALPSSVNEREPDEAYRQRLRLLRPFLMPSRRQLEARLNQLGAPANAVFTLREPNAEFAMAMQLVSAPDDAPRQAFLAALRANHLVQPGQPLPATRLLSRLERDQQQALLMRLATTFAFPAGASLSPELAAALDRAGRCRVALGVTRPWKVLRAQDDAGGSRFELGLGVEVEVPPAAEIDQLATRLRASSFAAGTDLQTQLLLGSLTPAPSSDDPIGRWLLAACGLKTVHQSAADRYYLSHVPVFATTLRADGNPLAFQARFEAPGDPGANAVLWYGLRDAAADARAAGIPAWTELGSDDAHAAWAQAAAAPAPALVAFAAAGLLQAPSGAADLVSAAALLPAVAPELVTTLKLDAGLAAGVLANQPTATAQLTALVGALRARELASVLPLVRGGDVLLVVGATSLPGAATTLSARRLGFRWYVQPINGVAGALTNTVGARSQYQPAAGASLALVIAVSLARGDQDDPRGRVAPYQVRVELPDGALIDLATFERVMNLCERAAPIGVVIDTSALRERHIDPVGQGVAVPLIGRLTRAFRTFQQRRHLGLVNTD